MESPENISKLESIKSRLEQIHKELNEFEPTDSAVEDFLYDADDQIDDLESSIGDALVEAKRNHSES